MAESHYSAEAHVLVNELHDRIRPMTGQMVWKPVALALAEVLLKLEADYRSLLISDYSNDDIVDRDKKDYLSIEVWKWLEAKRGNA